MIETRRTFAATLCAAVLLAGCGGDGSDGGDGSSDPSGSSADACSVAEQQSWLAALMNDGYFWYRISPHPAPAGYASVDAYFDALLYAGSDPAFPADRWSYTTTTEVFNRLFDDGQSLGYGISVAGLEVDGRPDQPLYVRYVEARSNAAARGVVRGDRVLSINGRLAADIIAGGDYSVLTAQASGDSVALVLRDANGADRSVTVTAGVYDLTPLASSAVVTTTAGRRLGYVAVKDMIRQAEAPLDAAFAQFRAAGGVDDVVLDLRYNGGGLVSTGALVASYAAGSRGSGRTYASLLFNDRHAADNRSYAFSTPAAAAGSGRVYVLAGARTCSASEQVVNGLRGIGVDVVAIGDTTCGKPVGFVPDDHCGTTYSVVKFESVNARNEGRYFDGFAPTCGVAEDFSVAQGSSADPLLAAARTFADSGSCPAAAAATQQRPLSLRAPRSRVIDDGRTTPGMVVR